jgi:hypothetical protein
MGSSNRIFLKDGTYIDWSVTSTQPDRWRPHGVHYRICWIQNRKVRVLFDYHAGKKDHFHLDGIENDYDFESVEKVWEDFKDEIRKLGGSVDENA